MAPPPTKSLPRLLDCAGASTLDEPGPMKRGKKERKKRRGKKKKREKKEGEKVRPVRHAKDLFAICTPAYE